MEQSGEKKAVRHPSGSPGLTDGAGYANGLADFMQDKSTTEELGMADGEGFRPKARPMTKLSRGGKFK